MSTPDRRRRSAGADALDDETVEQDLLERFSDTLDEVAKGRLSLLDHARHGDGGWQRVGNYSRTGEMVKDALDRVLATIGLLLVSPVLLAIGLAVRLDSPGPAFFRQTRIGRGGRPFQFWKFRGMFVDAKTRFPELYDYQYNAEQVQELRFHPPIDPRVTRVGHFIRRTSLDELPNLVNVVLGDMSLVGPRPEIPELLPYYGSSAKLVLSVKPGITSLAKLLGRDHFTFQETLDLDLRYVRERSLRMDIGILLGTVWLVLTGRSEGK